MESKFKSGFVALVGRPNVGKSTLLNQLVGQKVSIISPKPQTTRDAIRAIFTNNKCQMIFVDTPGLHKPKNKLEKYMEASALDILNDADVILFMIDATKMGISVQDEYIIEKLKAIDAPVFLLINKADISKEENITALMNIYSINLQFNDLIPLSAIGGVGVDKILTCIENVLPEGPKYFPEDIISDRTERFMVSEAVREKILKFVQQEIPHGIGVEVLEFRERKNKPIIDIKINIYCEKESHKGILIGKDGKMLRRIGMMSRKELECMLESKIFMELWVKVKPDWRNNERMLRTLGYR